MWEDLPFPKRNSSFKRAGEPKLRRRPMSRSRTKIVASLPIVFGLPEEEAAVSIGVSPTKFRELVARNLMPKPRKIDGRKSYDVDELRESYKSLPKEGEDLGADTWAGV